MKLRQLDYLVAVVENDLNVTAAARKSHTSQPGVSRQLRLLERELGFPIFNREGRSLARMTPAGRQIVERAQRVLREVKSIRGLSHQLLNEEIGTLSVGATNMQARYILPEIVRDFRARYPRVQLHIHQGTPEHLAALSAGDKIDFAIVSGTVDALPELLWLPCYRWHRTVIVPPEHPLARSAQLSLQELAQYPLLTYHHNFHGNASVDAVFKAAGLTPQVALTAHDADVIKAHVRHGLGVGIAASVAIDPRHDGDLVALPAAHLFPQITTWAGFRRTGLLHGYMYDFLQRLAPHLDRRRVDVARSHESSASINQLFEPIRIPIR